MIKEVKKLLIPLSILGILILALVIYLVVDANRKSNLNEQLQSKKYSIFEAEDLSKMEIRSSEGEETYFEFDGANGILSASHNGEKIDVSQINSSAVYEYVSQFQKLSVIREVATENIDPTLYGLDNDLYTLTVTLKNGNTNVLHFGKRLEDHSGIFFRLDNENSVCILKDSYFQNLSSEFENLLNLRVISLEKAFVSDITFTRTQRKDKIVVHVSEEKNTSLISTLRYKVVSPVESEPKTEFVELLNKVLDFQVTQFMNIPKDDFPSYGLDQPEFTISIKKTDGETIDIFLSREIQSQYYGYSSNSSLTFKINASYLSGLNRPINELFDTYVRFEHLDEVRDATVTIKDKSFLFEILVDKEQNSVFTDKSYLKLDYRDARVITSGNDPECYGLMLFQSIFWMEYSQVDKEANPELKDPEATIRVLRTNGDLYTIKLVARDSQTYYCFINDQYSGFILDRSVLYRDNGQYLSGFGIWDAYNLCNEAIDNKNLYGVYDRPVNG